ncbi:ABC transporter permease [Mycetocola tolaasinivorans]|uniref:ABC transporter permease n=1 Tax=Mycetocola tolaasinivorans TaxID=76635 RepID=A0A3L7A683_9MICO|nr:ABC transporter permease [Mycetocola tolaasinivorans]RLP75624.1 ABC transporter permease [Mycetocola tolaasinivorans]
MFVAWREIRFARGRFVLIGSVVALITILVGFLTGLTAGLAGQNVSAVMGLGADRIVFSAPAHGESDPSFGDSSITPEQASTWSDAAGVNTAEPLGISQTRLSAGERRSPAALFGVSSAGTHTLLPEGVPGPHSGEIVLGTSVAKTLGVSTGATVGAFGLDLRVSAVIDDAWYAHSSVAWLTLPDWQEAMARGGQPAWATVLAVSLTDAAQPDAIDAAAHTASRAPLPALLSIESFRSEIGSLLLIVGMLFGISALVIGAFFTVWTIQRAPDIAVLKALGARTGRLVRDTLGQALVVLLAGVGVGMLATIGLGLLAGSAVPFVLSPATIALPALGLIILGLIGGAFALRPVLRSDPLAALGAPR